MTYIGVFMFADADTVERTSIDKDMTGVDMHCTHSEWQTVHVISI